MKTRSNPWGSSTRMYCVYHNFNKVLILIHDREICFELHTWVVNAPFLQVTKLATKTWCSSSRNCRADKFFLWKRSTGSRPGNLSLVVVNYQWYRSMAWKSYPNPMTRLIFAYFGKVCFFWNCRQILQIEFQFMVLDRIVRAWYVNFFVEKKFYKADTLHKHCLWYVE